MSASSAKKQRGDKEKDKEDEGYGHPTKLTSTKKPEKRSSKHAPVEMTAKKPVSRKRDFLTVTAETKKPQPRDPRFMPLGPGASAGSGSGSKIDEIKARKAYAFLDEYRESEMQQLRAAIKKTKDPAQKEQLQRALTSMESRKKAQERKDRERAVLEEHRRKEKELVRQGKTPFYLKRSEQKKRVLVEQFQGLKKKQVDKVIERRRKKVAAREKKLLPMARRGAEDR
jgi:ribosomal RNA-processing protein 36